MSTYKMQNINNRPPQPVDLGFWAQIRFDASDVLPDYVGLHDTATAVEADTNWKVYKFTYNVSSEVTRIQFLYGSWTGRAALSW